MEALKVFCYFNLHKKVWSVRAMEGPQKGKVIAHRETVYLLDASPKVSEAGRQRVISEGRKNVHAGITGYWSDAVIPPESLGVFMGSSAITYNPYKNRTFVYRDFRNKVWSGARLVRLDAINRCVASYLIGRRIDLGSGGYTHKSGDL